MVRKMRICNFCKALYDKKGVKVEITIENANKETYRFCGLFCTMQGMNSLITNTFRVFKEEMEKTKIDNERI